MDAVRESYLRVLARPAARPARRPGRPPVDTEEHLAALVVERDPAALADLRRQVLAPLRRRCDRPPRSGSSRRCASGCCTRAGATTSPRALHVHPQTVRYRMGQVRELFGDRLNDPDVVLALTVALASDPPAARPV